MLFKINLLKYKPGLEDELGYQRCQNGMKYWNTAQSIHRPLFFNISILGRHLMLFLILGPSSLLVVVAQPDEKHANRTASVLE